MKSRRISASLIGSWKLTRTVVGTVLHNPIAKVEGMAKISKAGEIISSGTLLYEESGEMKFEGKSNKLNVSKSYYLRLRNCPKEEGKKPEIPGGTLSSASSSSSSSSSSTSSSSSNTFLSSKALLFPLDVYFTRDDNGGAVTELTSKTHYISFEEEASPLDDVSKDGHISSTVHHCGDDLYSAKLYVLAEETFKTECVVKGPKKDFTIVSKYVHVPAA
mmetsp:Transcript_37431/g.60097  ORF Transcript_37431/g.60097 Transcript_37431/m.60097 type:complete len:218 (+) Transcript_37431:97-750(+)